MSVMDRSRAITAEDLIRRYNLEGLKTDRKNITNINNTLTRQDNIIKNYVTNITPYKSQAKTYLTAWFFNGLPTLETEPFINFSEDEKESRLNDIYYNQDTGFIYQLIKNDEYEWLLLDDENLRTSLAYANSEADTSDHKRNIYYDIPTTPYEVGDIWINGNSVMRCRCARSEGDYNPVDWCIQTEYSDEFVLLETRAILNQFKTTVEENYTTKVQLEATEDSILGVVSSETSRVETTINNNYQDLIGKLDEKATVESVTSVEKSVTELQTSTAQTTKVVTEIKENGVTKVKTETGFTLDEDGLHIDKTDAATGSTLDEAGLEIEDKTGSTEETQFYSGYVTEEMAEKTEELADYQGQTVTYSKNIIFNNYLETKNARIENVYDDTYGKGIGFFAGGDS